MGEGNPEAVLGGHLSLGKGAKGLKCKIYNNKPTSHHHQDNARPALYLLMPLPLSPIQRGVREWAQRAEAETLPILSLLLILQHSEVTFVS